MGSDSCFVTIGCRSSGFLVIWIRYSVFNDGGLVLRRRFWWCCWSGGIGVVVLAVFVAHCVFRWWLTDLGDGDGYGAVFDGDGCGPDGDEDGFSLGGD
jgi:hypothetical protein